LIPLLFIIEIFGTYFTHFYATLCSGVARRGQVRARAPGRNPWERINSSVHFLV